MPRIEEQNGEKRSRRGVDVLPAWLVGVVLTVVASVAAGAAMAASGTPTAVQDLPELEQRARDAGLGRVAGAIALMARPSARIERRRAPMPSRLGTTRLGGSPDLPIGQKWPTCRRDPMAFLGQIAVDDLPLDVRGALPDGSLLSFFLHVEEEAPGFGAAEGYWLWAGRCGSALLSSAETRLVRRTAPRRNPRMVLRSAAVTFKRELTIPDQDDDSQLTPPASDVRLGRREQDRYWKFREKLVFGYPSDQVGHRFGGYATAVQLDPRFACGGPRDDWRLLLEFDSDELLGFEVADVGTGWLYARADDLAQGKVGRVCATFDST